MPAALTPLILAVDLGTSSVRTALFDAAGRRLPGTLTQRAHGVTHSDDGAAELDPAAVHANLDACLRATLARTGKKEVAAAGVSCFWHSLVGVDARGQALTPIYTWADSRCRHDAARLRTELDEQVYHRQTGCMLHTSYWPAKLRWLARRQARLFRRVARWVSPGEWLAGQYGGDGADACAYGMATGTGLFNPCTLAWEPGVVEQCGIRPDQLSPLSQDAWPVNAATAKRFPALAGARWWPAVGDGAAGNLGSGATRPGRAAINVGTSAAFRVMNEGSDAQGPFGLFCYRVDARRYVVGGAVSNAGNLRAWCRRELRLPANDAALDRALAARPGPVESLVTLPFWSAERAPTWREDLGGVMQGLSQNTTALDLLQATTEAVYHRLALIADLSLTDARATEIIVSGGILKSDHLLQRLADVLGRPVRPSLEPEASLRGAAVYALDRSNLGTREPENIRRLTGPAVRPRARYARLYAHERERQRDLEATLTRAADDRKQHKKP